MSTNLIVLISAISTIESNNNPRAVGDNGRAIGILQIHPVMVKEANRLLGTNAYTWPRDCFSVSNSYAIAGVYFSQWPSASYETLARRWNGGPHGDKKKATLVYWRKVKQVLSDHKQ